MLAYYLKLALRNLLRNKAYSALSIFSLSIGMSVALLIGLWTFYQFSYDHFLPSYEYAYSVNMRSFENGEVKVSNGTCLPLADVLKRDIPGIRHVAQAHWVGEHLLNTTDKNIVDRGLIAGDAFLKIFQFPLVNGDVNSVLLEPSSIVLTLSTARALFGEEDPAGKIVRFENRYDLKVTGVLRDVPAHSSLQFGFIIPFSFSVSHDDWVRENLNNWRNNSVQTFVSLDPVASLQQVQASMKDLAKRYNPEDYSVSKQELFLHALRQWHLYGEFENGVAAGGLIDDVKMFGLIGVLVLAISCINFMNLTTARSVKRTKEVGVRKAIGSHRKSIIAQFLTESVIAAAVALIASLLIIQLSLPAFNSLTRTIIAIPFDSVMFWLLMFGYMMITGIIAGSRPAFYLSSFNPVRVLRGSVQGGSRSSLSRRLLVVVQFTASIALINTTFIIYLQIKHAKDRSSGFNKDRLVMTYMNGELQSRYRPLKDALLQSGVVVGVTKSSSPVTELWSSQRIDKWQGRFPNESLELAAIGVTDADYLATMGIELVSGRNFNDTPGADSLSVILNESAVKRMRLKDPLGQIITWHDDPQNVRVIGVVKDALMGSPFGTPQPTIFAYTPEWSNVITYRLAEGVDLQQAIKKLEAVFTKFNPSYPYAYHFVDDAYAAKFEQESLIVTLFGLFAILAAFISCLGLFGLAAYMAEQRTREVGIRKVLGSSIGQVWMLLTGEFFLLVLSSCIIATPVAFYFMREWLLQYDYRIVISPAIFVFSAALAMFLTAVAVSFQALTAATANPAGNLRTE